VERLGDLLALLILALGGLLMFTGFEHYFFICLAVVLLMAISPRVISPLFSNGLAVSNG
jgi:hypothetical protein